MSTDPAIILDQLVVTSRERAYFEEGFRLARTLSAMTVEPRTDSTPLRAFERCLAVMASDIRGLKAPAKIAPIVEIPDGE